MTDSELAQAAELVTYDPATGAFHWKHSQERAETKQSKGYLRIRKSTLNVLAHRLAWFVAHGRPPENQIDHINRDKCDNRIANLRDVSGSENQFNRGPQANCASGFPGVARNRRKTKWQAYIKKQNRRIHLGTFERIEDAVAARRAAEGSWHAA